MDTIDLRYGPLDVIRALQGIGEEEISDLEFFRSEAFSDIGAQTWENMVNTMTFFGSFSQTDRDRMIFKGPEWAGKAFGGVSVGERSGGSKKVPNVPVSLHFKNARSFEGFKERLSSFFEGYPHLDDSEKAVCLRQCLGGRVAEYFESRPNDETQSYSKAMLMLENRYEAPRREYIRLSGLETMDAALRAYGCHSATSAVLNSDPKGGVASSNDEVVEREAELVSVPCGECTLIQKECEREVGSGVVTHGERLCSQKECEREMVVVIETNHGERSRFQNGCEREVGVGVVMDGTETGQEEWDQDIGLQLATEMPWVCWEFRRLGEYGAFRPILPDIAGVGFTGWLQSSDMYLPSKLSLPECRERPPDVLFTTVSDMLHSAAVNDHRSGLSDMWNETGLAHEDVECDMSMPYDVMDERPVWGSEDGLSPNVHGGVFGDSDVQTGVFWPSSSGLAMDVWWMVDLGKPPDMRTGIFWPSSSRLAMDVWWMVDLGKPPDFLRSGTIQSALHKMWIFGSGRPPDISGTSLIRVFTDRFRFATCGMHELFFHWFLGAEPGKPPSIQSDASWCLVSELLFHRYSCIGPYVPLCVLLEVVHSVQIKSYIEVYSHICDSAFLECVDLLRLQLYCSVGCDDLRRFHGISSLCLDVRGYFWTLG